MLQSKAGYIDARPHIRQLDEVLLQRTAGPYIRGQFRTYALQQTARMGSLIDRLRAPAIDHPGLGKAAFD